jgi:putative ABC transport system permease protein
MKIHGVVADFHIESLKEPTRPTLYHCSAGLTSGYISLKTGAQSIPELLKQTELLWKQTFPESPFEYWFMDEQFGQQYRAENQLAFVFSLFTALAILVACLGLFGLSTFTAEQRRKEIGIRKVLGASVASVVALLSKDFLKLVLIATALASPIAWYAMTEWLQGFAYRITIDWWVFALAGLFAVGIALLTVSFQSVKTALTNPVKSLRTE